MGPKNATDLFENSDSASGDLPVSSESFWSTLFALFLLHLAGTENHRLPTWRAIEQDGEGHWFEPFTPIVLDRLSFKDLCVEPTEGLFR
jgi:hypothetical protein